MIKKISMRIYCLLLIIVVYLRQYGTHLAFRLESIRKELLPELKEKDDAVFIEMSISTAYFVFVRLCYSSAHLTDLDV